MSRLAGSSTTWTSRPARVSREDAPPPSGAICRWGYRNRESARQAEGGVVIDSRAGGEIGKNARAFGRARGQKAPPRPPT